MKNKQLTYFLIVVVAGLWGLIIYRIVDAVNSGDDNSGIPSLTPAKEAFNDFTIPKDTTHLLLNYRDPFGIGKPKDTVEKPINISRTKIAPVQTKPAVNWSFISYSGYIRNPVSKKLVALVSINGQNLTLAEGETKDQVKLLKNMKDSIKVGFQGKTKFIALKSVSL